MEQTPVASSSKPVQQESAPPPLESESEQHAAAPTEEEEDSDGLLEELEEELDNDFDLGGFRERRMEELRAQVEKSKAMKESNYGRYTEIKSEKDLISMTAKAPRCILHFFHRDFRRCKIMDGHLEKLAAKHFDTLFLRAEVSNVPFLVNKMEIQVLPCVVGFVGGISKMKIVGFDELDGGDGFDTASLELVMLQCDAINKTPGIGLHKSLTTSAASSARARPAGRGIRGGGTGSDSD